MYILHTHLVSGNVKFFKYLSDGSSVEVEEKPKSLKLFCWYIVAAVFIQQLKHSPRMTEDELFLLFVLYELCVWVLIYVRDCIKI